MTLSAQPRNFIVPAYLSAFHSSRLLQVRAIDLAIVLLAIVLMTALALFVRFTKVGMAMRATAENYEVARPWASISTAPNHAGVCHRLTGALAIAGLMWGSKYSQISR